MKPLLIALTLLLPLAAAATSAEESYLASRDRYIATFNPKGQPLNIDDKVLDEHERALDDLGKQLGGVVGPVEFNGVAAKGKINLGSLVQGDIGFGTLDALVYSLDDDKTHIVVTTEGLLTRWVRAHRNWWEPNVANVPQDIGEALKSDPFYTQALNTDAAVTKFAVIPIAKPANAKFAFAMLVARQQDIGRAVPDEIIVSLRRGGRVFVATTTVNIKTGAIAACDRIWRGYENKAKAAQDAYIASQLTDAKASAERSRLEQHGDAAFHRCYAERAKRQAFFPGLAKAAQALLARLPAR